MICPNCQREITDGVKFCKFCGSPIASEAPAAAPVAQPAPAEFPQPAPVETNPMPPVAAAPYMNAQAPDAVAPADPLASPYAVQPPVDGMLIPDGDPKKKKKKPKKKMSKGKKAILSIFLSLLSISIVGAALLLIFFPLDRFYVSEEVTIYYYGDDETKYEYTYNKNGNPLKFKKDGETQTEYKYDEKGKLLSVTSVITDEDGKEEKKTYELEYTKTKDGMIGSYEDKEEETKEEITYNKMNKPVKIVTEDGDYNQTITQKYNIFGYATYVEIITTDGEGNETKSYYHYDYKGEPVLSETYSNDELTSSVQYKKGIIAKSSRAAETDVKDGKTYILVYQNRVYDKKGNLIESKTYNENDELIAEIVATEQNDDEIKLTRYENDEVVGYRTYKLDKDGNITKEEVFDENEELIYYYEYEYDKHGNCIEEKEYDEEDNLESKTKTTYERKPIFNW